MMENMGLSEMAFLSSSLKYPFVTFLQSPVFLRGCSVFVHLILFTGIVLSWVCKKLRGGSNQNPKDEVSRYSKPVFISSLIISLYNLLLCLLDYFLWYENSWTYEKRVTLLDLAIRALAWLFLSVYLHTQFRYMSCLKFPLLLRIWWGFYLSFSCYCLFIDIVQWRQGLFISSIQILLSDTVYVISGIYFCCAGVFGKGVKVDSNVQEPLLDGNGGVDPSKNEKSETVSPYLNADFLSKATFSWVGSLISKGYKKTLDLEDVPPLSGKDDVNESIKIFRSFLDSSRGDSGRIVTTMQLVKALICTAWADILLSALYCLLYTLSSYVGPYLIDTFVQYLSGKREFKNEGYFLVFVFFAAKVVECFGMRHWFVKHKIVGVRAKAVLMESIYDKALNLSCQSKQSYTSGEMINLMSVDAERVGNFSWYMHDPWMVILQVALALLILYGSLGLASIATLISTVLVMLANYPLSVLLEKHQEKVMESKDKRMKATSEILKNMRILKLQAWEMKFLSKIFELRDTENRWLKKFLYTLAILTSVFWTAPTFVSVITFCACIIMGIPLESGKLLAALATFQILQEPIYTLPDTIAMISQTKVSLDRISSFLCLDELKSDTVEKLPRAMSEFAVEIIEGNFSWDLSAPSPTLKDISLRVRHGVKIAVCGTVGSGKSTLLSCMLGEVPKISGTLKLNGLTAYVPQTPWIQSGKLVDNILFGCEMDNEIYNGVLEACSLKKDLEILPFGDQTIIGERGINLSGGQKQRIQLARALYQDADIYLFDDPFSAVDAHTGSHLFKECVLGLSRSKTVIYVTHQVEFLPAADLILVMKDGRILQAGKYDDILQSGTDFKILVGAHEEALSAIDSIDSKVGNSNVNKAHSSLATKALEEERNGAQSDTIDDTTVPKAQLVQEEEREKGKVGLSVYWKYITTAYGGALVPFILMSQILFQALQILSNYWMAWATPVSLDSRPTVDGSTLILVYVALAAGSTLCVLVRSTLVVTAAYMTATSLFSKMHYCLFRAPMSSFDATPSGRVLNRVSTDQSAVDATIPNLVASVVFTAIQLLGIVLIMSLVAWQVFVIFIPIAALSLWYQQYYLPTSRELSRLVGVTKAPVIQHFSETITGAVTIRCFDQESRFSETSVKLINGYSQPAFYSAASMEWLSLRLELLSSIIFVCSLLFLVCVPVGLIDPAIAGLAVTYGLSLNSIQGWMISKLCNVENRMISVERILQYTCIPSEPPLVIEENRPDRSWPSCGEVTIQDLQVRYARHLPLVLRGITCTFQGGKKSGIVGRTGSGKSTVIQALFRIVEPTAGQIIIDDVNISSIGLHDLRSRLSIIPQDPTMFEGTIRSNLDPLGEYTDEQIWEALDKCQLGDEVRKKEERLDSIVTENGENWSMGQRQLVCLGRVILKRSKVLVLDEATASVDTATDSLIQQTLREHFSDSTVIIIAHRITSVIDSDMVVVLRDGLVEESDSPLSLLENKSSAFAKLAAEYKTRSKATS